MLDLDHRDDLAALASVGFLCPKFFTPTHWAAVIPTGSFAAIVDGDRSALSIGYQNLWQYGSLSAASVALHDWNGEGQPREWISAKLMQDLTAWP